MSLPSTLLNLVKKYPKTTAGGGSLLGLGILNKMLSPNQDQVPQQASTSLSTSNGANNMSNIDSSLLPRNTIRTAEFTPLPVQDKTPKTNQIPQTSQTWDSMLSPINSSTATPVTTPASTTMSSQVQTTSSPSRDFDMMRQKQMMDRANGTGDYYLDPSIPLSPDQINQHYKSIDNVYSEKLGQKAYEAKKLLEAQTSGALDPSKLSDLAKQSSYVEPNSGISDLEYTQGLLNLDKIGNSGADTKRMIANLQSVKPEQRVNYIKTTVINALPQADRQVYDTNKNTSQQVDYIANNFSDVKSNPYKYTGQKFTTYLGGAKDQKYVDFASNVAALVIPLRKNYFGASLTPGEEASANQWVPDLKVDDMGTVITKLQNIKALAEFANTQKIRSSLGLPSPTLSEFMANKGNTNTGGTTNNTNTTNSVGWFQ